MLSTRHITGLFFIDILVMSGVAPVLADTFDLSDNAISPLVVQFGDSVEEMAAIVELKSNFPMARVVEFSAYDIGQCKDDGYIKSAIVNSIILDKLFDLTIAFIGYVAVGTIAAGPPGAIAAAAIYSVILGLDFVLDIWNAILAVRFFENEVGLNTKTYYDFYIDEGETFGLGYDFMQILGFKSAIIAQFTYYIDIWDGERTYKIVRVRQEQTLVFGFSGLFNNIDLLSSSVDWDLIERYPSSEPPIPKAGGTSGSWR